ncbi:MAG: nucleotidyltransferase domain-containing protein [Gammaproteobacteria bacterium]|nr:MAG: nucleotidyltransferase domain-containing protein [Gammaproteobacteria bacterium]
MISAHQQEQIIKTILATFPKVVAMYLFGSVATGTEHKDSDLDLALLSADGGLPPVQLWELAQALFPLVGRDVDLVDLQDASTILRLEVIKQGRRLYCSDPVLCEEFESRVYSDYARLNEERAAILEDIKQRGTVHG